MPKRGGGRGGRNWNNGGGDRGDGQQRDQRGYSNSYNEHDNRGHENNVRRVSFKPNANKIHKNKNNRSWDAAIKHFNDEDIDMSGQSSNAGGRNPNNNFRGNFRGRGRRDGRVNSPAPRPNHIPRKLLPGISPWYQITIPFGQQHEKNFLLNALLTALSPETFVPYFYSIVGNAAIFYVDDFGMAEKLNNLDRTITMPNGFKLAVKVKSGTPHVQVDKDLLDKMKIAMAGRYNPVTKALDLTKFHADPSLVDVFCALFRPSIMLAAINIISENIPEIQALNLNENKLHVLDHFKSLLNKLPNLKILYLAKNRIPHINSLEPLTGLPLVELFLEGNPLADRFKEKDVYVREVRKRFPKMMRLDGNDLPPVIGFDINDEVSLPPSRASFLCNAEGQLIVRQFLEQYFAIYDSESRQSLLDAYHENAMFSMTAHYGPGQVQGSSYNRLNAYITVSRNIMRLQERDIRRRTLKNGRLQVVSFLNDLPKSQHDPLSFCVDLTLFTPAIIMLTVSGVFKELATVGASKPHTNPPLRAFHKTMIIVPHGSGFCIRNDMVHITNATIEQEEKSFKTPEPTGPPPPYSLPQASMNPMQPPMNPMNQMQPSMNPMNPMNPMAPLQAPQPDTHQQMLQAFAQHTNMNLQWSTSCLEQTNWDFQRAALVFDNLNKEGKIPPEAFVK